MRYLIWLFLFLSITAKAQEAWLTVNLTNPVNSKWNLLTEAEERYNFDRTRTRYFHYDVGIQRVMNQRVKLGAYFRELYEIKSEKRVIEKRPHIDLHYTSLDKRYKLRVRTEYQFREHPILKDQWRIRMRPERWWPNKKLQPYLQEEVFFNKTGLVRSRSSAGITIGKGKWQTLLGVILEENKVGDQWVGVRCLSVMLKGI